MEKVANKLIILQGNSNAGKTSVLLKVINELINIKKFSQITPTKRGRDQRVLLKNKNGFSIVICTAGDTLAIVEENYRFFIKNSCDIMVSACSINVATHMSGSRTNLVKTSLIGFASGYWKSANVHFNLDSTHVKLLTLKNLLDTQEMAEMKNNIIQEIFA